MIVLLIPLCAALLWLEVYLGDYCPSREGRRMVRLCARHDAGELTMRQVLVKLDRLHRSLR